MALRAGEPEVWIVAAKRTPFGAMNGSLSSLSATDLATIAAKDAIAQSGLAPTDIDQVVVGNVQQTSADAIYIARHVGLRSGIPIEVPALIVNRLCGSGFQALVSGAEQILTRQAQVVLCAGSESMSQAPHVVRGLRNGLRFGSSPTLEDSLATGLTDSYCQAPMGVTAENLAKDHEISREQTDAFALLSQQRWKAAHDEGRFKEELAIVEVQTRKGPKTVAQDECPRPETTLEALRALSPVFKKDGIVTAGSSSGIADGAGAVIAVSAEFAKHRNAKPLARLVSWGIAGVDPTRMGIGPVPAIRKALEHAELKLSDIQLFDINEAFAPQFLSVQHELDLPMEITNVNGGAIALGHPLGASGSRITANLIYQLRRDKKRLGVGAACIGGGQGIAVVLEALY